MLLGILLYIKKKKENLVIYTLHVLFPQAGKTLSQRRWQASFSEDGHLDIAKVLRRIQRGVTFIVYLYTACNFVAESISNEL